MNNHFEVDKAGLAKLLERRGMAHVLFELYQNAVDADGVTEVGITLENAGAHPMRRIVVSDDCPTGFKRLSDAWTLFSPSEKKSNAQLRGRFNLGEKLVIALCRAVEIRSTTGTVIFDEDGRRTSKQCTGKGSIFSGTFKATNGQFEEIKAAAARLIVPGGVKVTFNGDQIPSRKLVGSFEESLLTEVADTDGVLRRVVRKTAVELYEPRDGETACVYEMGIPVVETHDKYHYNVCQRVPLTFERDNVSPAYLRTLRTFALNATFAEITQADANAAWCREAAGDKRTVSAAIVKVADERFGKERVSFDVNDQEANSTAQYKGYSVLHGRNLSADEWEQLRRANAIQSAGSVFPTPKPYGNGPMEEVIPESEWTEDMQKASRYSVLVAKELIDRTLTIRMTKAGNNFQACYGCATLTYNLNGGCTPAFFAQVGSVAFDDLLLHELGHEAASDHRSDEYHKALTRLGAKLKKLALEKPEVFK